MSVLLKLENEKGECKKIKYPESFDELIKAVKEFVPSLDNQKRYQLIDEKKGREIATQENFEIMTNEYLNNKITPKIRINLVDNNSKYIKPKLQLNNKNIKQIINESIINIPGNNKNEDKAINGQNEMESIIKKKLKELEDKLVDELYNNSMMEIEKSKINNQNKGFKKNNSIKIQVHEGIICNKCGLEIVGERFKCCQCQNFNLCENCEKNYNHDMRHIMVSIIFPIKNESEFSMKLDKNIRYKNENMNYNLEPKIFSFNRVNDIQIQEITIKNIGTQSWKGVVLKCIEDKSEIIGQDCMIDETMEPNKEIKTKITFSNIDNQAKKGKNVYYSFFQMFNKRNETFGNITKIKIIFNNN